MNPNDPTTINAATVLWLRQHMNGERWQPLPDPQPDTDPLNGKSFAEYLAKVGGVNAAAGMTRPGRPEMVSAREVLGIYQETWPGREPGVGARVRPALAARIAGYLADRGHPDPEGMAAQLAWLWACQGERTARIDAAAHAEGVRSRTCPVCGHTGTVTARPMCLPCAQSFEYEKRVAASKERIGEKTRGQLVREWMATS